MAQCYSCKTALADSTFCGSCGTQVRCSVLGCDRVFEGAAHQRAHLIDCHPEIARANSVTTKALASLKQHATTVSGKVATVTQSVIEQAGPALKQPPKKELLMIAGALGVPLAFICLLFMGMVSLVVFAKCADPQRQFYGEWEDRDSPAGPLTAVIYRNRTLKVILTNPSGQLVEHVFNWVPDGTNSLLMSDPVERGLEAQIIYKPKTDTLVCAANGTQREFERK